ncbi:restriction endonuclease subunit S [Butyrivibrio fibrisolvens]|uniref:restriction endonuclease subunit S n=1 Tax=Pseudobutyrivibrio ruminis TaxID=46206 RepID=UPI001FA758AE|nr:restriction endonuclease subunit S [Pseudobutyrivibrio ruminis]MDC7279366.1 restriction endonuclease subunit S [Butyrivibrio fibrisolvens]
MEVSKAKNKDETYGKEDVLSVSGDYGIVNQIEFQGRSFAGVSVAPYGVVETGDVVYTKSPLKSNPYGIIKTNKGNPGIVSTLYAVYKPLDNVYSEFIQIYFEQDARMNNYMHPLVNKGAKNDMKVSDENALKGEVCFPSREEQIRISEYFAKLDNLITLHQCKHNYTPIAFALQKTNNSTPSWEQRKLGELCERVTRKNKTGESDLPLTIASQYGLIDQRDFFNKVVAAKDMSNYYLLKKGEFAYNKSYSNGYDFGSIKRLNAYEQGCLSTLYICFGITSDDIESDYLECFFDTLKWYSDITMICAEGARNHGLLNVDTKAFFDEVTIEMPSSKEEQRKISSYLNNLDNLITLHQR